MKFIAPDYIFNFKCDGKLCNSYCCKDWKVTIDENTKNKYENLPKDEREEILSCIGEDENGSCFLKLNEKSSCHFLGEDCLCKMQKKYGEDYLSDICFSYPRVTHKIGDIIQQSLTLSCPIAAELALFSESISFIETDTPPKRLGWYTNLTNRRIFQEEPLSLEYLENLESAGLFLLSKSEIPLKTRLSLLLTFYEKAEANIGNKNKTKELLSLVESGEFQRDFSSVKSYDAIFERSGYLQLVLKLFASLYDFNATDDKLNDLIKIYDAEFQKFQGMVIDRNSQVFTNYLMNEFFMRVYPCAFDDGFAVNARVFVLSWEVLKFALFILYVQGGLNEERVIFGVRQLIERLDHGKGVMEKLLKIAKE
ncbi:MAG: flagellin lysine-N-methylase [Selenomonadaceae bacterium]|nr:flagellin lysine-N-methylase [Selenomonadaceae bacterium]